MQYAYSAFRDGKEGKAVPAAEAQNPGSEIDPGESSNAYAAPTTALIAATFTISLTLHPLERSNAGLWSP